MATGGWDKTANQPPFVLKGHTDVINHGAFAPDGRTLATASWDGTVKLWHVATGQELMTLEGHKEYVWCLAFSPDGTVLASGSRDREEEG
jgi:WD40 repeat protein